MYLGHNLMNKLFPKLEKELGPGTVVISCDFTFDNKQPEKVIDLGRREERLAKKLYIYRF